MDQQQIEQLVAYTRQRLERGDSEEAIKQTFQQYALSDELSEQLLAQARSQVAPTTPAAVEQPVTYSPEATTEPVEAPVSGEAIQLTSEARPDSTRNNFTPVTPNYRVLTAMTDALAAIKSNFVNVAAVSVVGAVIIALGFAAMFAILLLAGPWLVGGHSGSMDKPIFDISYLIKPFLIGVVFNIILGVLAALALTLISLAIKDGASGNRHSLGQLFKYSFKRLGWVVLAAVQLWLITFGPLLALALIGLFASMADLQVVTFLIGAIAVIGGFGWAIIAILRYTLMPYVAMFEPQVKPSQLARRTFQLVRHGGQWFTFKLILLSLAVSIVMSLIFAPFDDIAGIGILGVIVNLAVWVVFNAGIVMLYLNKSALIAQKGQ